MKTIGIVGTGFVGEAVRCGLNKVFDTVTFDIRSGLTCYNAKVAGPWRHECLLRDESPIALYEQMLRLVDGPIFICVPTPMLKTNPPSLVQSTPLECDLDAVVNVLELLSTANKKLGLAAKTVVALKSTVPPGTTEQLNGDYDNLQICFNPEFLTERNAIEDFRNQDRIIIGGPHRGTTIIKQMYEMAFPGVPVTKTSSTIAEFVKYMTNCFLAVKVAFANELQQMCEALDADYDKVVEYAIKDKRLGTSHWSVPGPDGKEGFGGKCFCKDLNAMMFLAETLGVDCHTMTGAWKTNLEVRPEKDWEAINGVVSPAP